MYGKNYCKVQKSLKLKLEHDSEFEIVRQIQQLALESDEQSSLCKFLLLFQQCTSHGEGFTWTRAGCSCSFPSSLLAPQFVSSFGNATLLESLLRSASANFTLLPFSLTLALTLPYSSFFSALTFPFFFNPLSCSHNVGTKGPRLKHFQALTPKRL